MHSPEGKTFPEPTQGQTRPSEAPTVTDSVLYEKLTQIFREVFEDDEIVLGPETTADKTKGWDSLKNVRLMLTIEKGFGVKIATSEMLRMQNVGDLAALIGRKV